MSNRNDPIDIWAWTKEDAERLVQQGGQHQAIIANYQDFWSNYNDDYVSAELAISQALEAARETDEIKWQLHLRHWRLQLWLKQRQIRRALPEAVDLLSLTNDPRVRDLPQRICAFHDIVECYVQLDPAGYHDDIVANSQDVLAQLPKSHPCATCARANLARTSAAIGDVEETDRWINQVKATMAENVYNALTIGFGTDNVLLGNWDEAERYFLEAQGAAEEQKNRIDFIRTTLNLVRVYLEKSDIQKAMDLLQLVRKNMKFQSYPDDLAKLAEMEGRLAVVVRHPLIALGHLAQAAHLYFDLGCYLDAAQMALFASEVARDEMLMPPEGILDLAAQAVGQLPSTSQDVYQRLATFEREPAEIPADAQPPEITSAQDLVQKELQTLENLLQEHIIQHHYSDVCMTLYRLAIWYGEHNQIRAAIDYLIAEAALERLMRLPLDERVAAIRMLRRLREDLPEGAIEAAITANESRPSPWIQPLFPRISLPHWLWILRGIEAEVAERPFVDPEPEADPQDSEGTFNDWLNHVASMTALILRFYNQYDTQEFVPWADAMDATADEIATRNSDAPEKEIAPLLNLVRGFASLARGMAVEEVIASCQPPFVDIIIQISQLAKAPVWFHPGSTPVDFLVEEASQKAVRSLRLYDEERETRLQNLALRYKLMTIDLRTQESLMPMADFLDALRALVLLDGKQLPKLEQPLEKPYDAILAAIFEDARLEAANKAE